MTELERKHLVETDRHIAECREYIAKQREHIERAIEHGRSFLENKVGQVIQHVDCLAGREHYSLRHLRTWRELR